MRSSFQRRREERYHWEKLYDAPEYRPLKVSAITVISIGIGLIATQIIWMDELSLRTRLIMDGCTGCCALIHVVLVTILLYRVNSRHIRNRHKLHDDHEMEP